MGCGQQVHHRRYTKICCSWHSSLSLRCPFSTGTNGAKGKSLQINRSSLAHEASTSRAVCSEILSFGLALRQKKRPKPKLPALKTDATAFASSIRSGLKDEPEGLKPRQRRAQTSLDEALCYANTNRCNQDEKRYIVRHTSQPRTV